VSDSIWSFDARQFAGWVPHQVIAYLWPQGPWYWLGSTVGLPDWVVGPSAFVLYSWTVTSGAVFFRTFPTPGMPSESPFDPKTPTVGASRD